MGILKWLNQHGSEKKEQPNSVPQYAHVVIGTQLISRNLGAMHHHAIVKSIKTDADGNLYYGLDNGTHYTRDGLLAAYILVRDADLSEIIIRGQKPL